MYYVYLIKSRKYEKIYIGYTSDLKRRLSEHNMGINIFTNRYKPWELIYYEAFKNKQDAQNREMKLKYHGNGIRQLKERLLSSLKNGAGFTLIETIVVIAVIGLTLPVLIGTIFILVRQQTKVIRLSQVKREGDYIINLMENTIRNRAISIHSGVPTEGNIVCKNVETYPPSGTVNNLYFLDKENQWFGYKLNVNKVASDSANPADLTSSKIIISNFSISCSRNTIYSPPSVSFDFDVCFVTGAGICTSTRPEETASLHYQTRIKLRSY